MAIDLDDEILQDFLIEAGEILEQLNGQLVDLEQSPEDYDLLNTIFRGFHTIKGGGSFLALTNLVEVCHQAEDVFNLLRNRELVLDSAMMDAFLRVLDEVNKMFDEVRHGIDPTPADSALLQSLIDMQISDLNSEVNDDDGSKVEEELEHNDEETDLTAENAARDFVASDGEITDEEFENLLDSLQQDKESNSEPKKESKPKKVESKKKSKSNNSDEISDEEFEALLDSLHGPSTGPKEPADKVSSVKKEKKEAPTIAKPKSKADDISDDEFESLLDDLHGKGKGPK